MTIEEIKAIVQKLHLDWDGKPNLIYLFYRSDDGLVNQLSISIHSAKQKNRRPMTDEQFAALMREYPAAREGSLMAIEHPKRGLTKWMDTFDVCEQLHTSRQSLGRWVKKGLLRPMKVGRKLYFDPEEIERMIRSNAIQSNGRIDTTWQEGQ
ncbi:MAG: helix-turn-helix domain-containing protein [Bacteroidales bacterium]|nr:helix-turn-helix domain-containing protein [Bacteroidales bacterium]